MNQKEAPEQIEGINDSLYGGFWLRLGSMFLDLIIVLPWIILLLYLNGLSKNAFFYTLIPNQIFILWYYVYLLKVNGGTPGKLVVGLKVIRLDGEPIGWREAILRNIVLLGLGLVNTFVLCYCLTQVDDATFASLTWIRQTQYLMTFAPVFFKLYTWTNNIWTYSEFIVLLTNKRKRAIHDFIAGTVIVQTKYLDKIRAEMGIKDSNDEVSPSIDTEDKAVELI